LYRESLQISFKHEGEAGGGSRSQAQADVQSSHEKAENRQTPDESRRLPMEDMDDILWVV
jgi:hypothetical protein